MAKKYPLMPPDMAARNTVGKDALFVAEAHAALYSDIAENFYSKRQGPPKFKLNPRISQGLTGVVEKIEASLPHGALNFPLSDTMPSLEDDRSIR
jgi:5'-3' exoribonuclease 2